MLTCDDAEDPDVPGMGITFGRLQQAQARAAISGHSSPGAGAWRTVHLARPEDVTQLA